MSQRALPRSRSRTGLVAVLVTVVVLGLATAVILPLRERSKIPFLPPSTRCQATLDDGRTATLDLEQARNASLIAGIATSRYLEPRATSIALATAFQESDIRNLDYGDLDSLGIFQQRPAAGWGTPEEIMDPYYSTNAFFDALVKLADWQTADIGVIAQEIQRSAYPDAYDKHVDRARILASVLTGETAAGWTCHVRDPAAADPAGLAAAVAQTYGRFAEVGAVAVADPADEAAVTSVTVTAATEPAAWSVAAFAQSWAAVYGIKTVQVGGYTWTGQPDVLSGWVLDPNAPTNATTLVITFL